MRLTIRCCSAVAGLSLVGCRAASSSAAQAPSCQRLQEGWGPSGKVQVKVEVVASGLEVPWGLAFLPNGDALVTERPGRVRLWREGKLVAEPVAVVSASGTRGEAGLLGVAVHPQFAANRSFYLYRTVASGDGTHNQVERWKLDAEGTHAAIDRVILAGIPGAEFHDGGRLRFGPDGMLYIGTGDGRDPDRSQDTKNLAGKILRLTADGEIPKDNPLGGSSTFIYGIRNTQGFDWLTPSVLVVTDHGPSGELMRRGLDEVNVARAGDNLGWPKVSGCDDVTGSVAPLMTWTTAAPPGGAAVYTGDKIPEWKGSVLIGTLGSRHLHRVTLSKELRTLEQHEVYFQGDPPAGFGRLRDVVNGPDGYLYVTTSNCDGRGTCPADQDKILRIVPSS